MEHLVSILSGFQHAANKNPSGIAVEDGDTRLSYSQLDQLSNQFAHGLIETALRLVPLLACFCHALGSSLLRPWRLSNVARSSRRLIAIVQHHGWMQ